MSDGYIEQHDGVYVVAGTRVSLDSIVYAFLSGQSAEAIAQAFSVLNVCLAKLGTVQARDAFSSETPTAVGTSIATKRSAANK
jgi:hypothetical protein